MQNRYLGTAGSRVSRGVRGEDSVRRGSVGSLPATVLRIGLIDASQVILYQGLGGIELQSHLAEHGFKAVPKSDLFADPQRDETAVSLALADLVTLKRP